MIISYNNNMSVNHTVTPSASTVHIDHTYYAVYECTRAQHFIRNYTVCQANFAILYDKNSVIIIHATPRHHSTPAISVVLMQK